MGDGSNVAIVQDDGQTKIYLYAHSLGEEIIKSFVHGMQMESRLTDGAYMTRIIFSHMIRGAEDLEFGFGISTKETMSMGHPILVFDPQTLEAAAGVWLEESYSGRPLTIPVTVSEFLWAVAKGGYTYEGLLAHLPLEE